MSQTPPEERPAQIQTFLGYESEINAAIKSGQTAANRWLAYHRLKREQVQVSAQTLAEVIPSREHVFYLHVVTIVY